MKATQRPESSERWLAVPGWEGLYEVSDHGRVRSLPRRTRAGMRGGRALVLTSDKLGYQRLYLCRYGERVTRLLHHLVLEAHDRQPAPGEECRHLDGNPANNMLDNLKWGTHLANEADKKLHGTLGIGERNSRAKLSESDVLEIRRLYAAGNYSQYKLADRFGVVRSHVGSIVTGKKRTQG